MIVHVDCNNFFVSCELSLRPDLKGRPAVVANVNEAGGGILLALNKEAKNLGLKRGNPIFKVKDAINKNNVIVFPVRHRFYQEVSAEIISLVSEEGILQDLVKYSIDEFFGSLPINDADEARHYVEVIKDGIYNKLGIPVSCGISTNYTLAKSATYFAKHYEGYKGICAITEDKRIAALKHLPIEDVWGIGRRNIPRLLNKGIRTAHDFANHLEALVIREMHEPGHRTWRELNGIACIELERNERQKSIMQSRTFAYMTSDKDLLRSLITEYATTCCSKLRQQQSVADTISVFLRTNRFRDDLQQYANSAVVKLTTPSCDTLCIVKAALQALNEIYQSGFMFKQAGVVLSGIYPNNDVQLDIFDDSDKIEQHLKLMRVTDALNARFGDKTIQLAVQQVNKKDKDK